MEPLGADVKVLIGAFLVMVIAAARFNSAPPAKPAADGGSRALTLLRQAFQFKPGPSLLFPPPRAQTTFFKFELYRVAYALTGVAVYLVLYAIPGVAGEVDKFLSLVSAERLPTLADAGPVLLALVVALLFPVLPPLRAGEWAVRRAFYDRACIPAQQLRESHRLKDAPYSADPDTLNTIRAHLIQEDFDPTDLAIDETPTTRSLWTKAAVLMTHIERWQGDDRYKTAFAALHEQDGLRRSVERLGEMYDGLKPDARMCFKALRELPGAPETDKREEAFRLHCREFLMSIYELLSRVSLHAHYTDRDRVRRMGALGFTLVPKENGPIPDPNDVAALSLLVAGVVFLPLSYKVTTVRAILISFEVYVAIVVPILIAARFPRFAAARSGGTPALAFPLVAGLVATCVGVLAHTLMLSVGENPRFDPVRGWSRYSELSYPWSSLLFLIAALIAWRMRAASYPDPGSLRGLARIKQWGSAMDAARFCVGSLALVGFYIRPKVAELWQAPERAGDPTLLLLPVVIATVIGFFVPTWYRANVAETRSKGTATAAPSVAASPS